MKRSLFGIACAMIGIASGVACATSTASEPLVEGDDGPNVVPDASVSRDATAPSADADALDASVDGPLCSTHGWCRVPLPDDHLSMIDIWPLENRAFALAKNPFFGTKLLEWDGAAQAWAYIDDDTQNDVTEDGFVREPATVWAPSEDEVYYTVTSKTSGYVYHGKRPAPPATAWTWTRARFVTCEHAKLWVYGTSRADVYAASCDTIYRKADHGQTDGAEPAGWVADHVDTEPTSHAVFLGASGTGPDEMWFAGGRRRAGSGTTTCGLLLHRTAAGYESIVDSTATGSSCGKLDGALLMGGQLYYAQRTGPSRIVANWGSASGAPGSSPVRITRAPGGDYEWESAKARPPGTSAWTAAWIPSEDDFWISRAGSGQLMRAKSAWDDGGAFEYSSIALNGSPILTPMLQVRGTSNTNLWAVGGNYVFHKTTP